MPNAYLDLCIALAIISPIEPVYPQHAPKAAWDSLKRVNVALQIAGPTANYGQDFSNELQWSRNWYRDAYYAPNIEEFMMLPPRSVLMAGVRVNSDYKWRLLAMKYSCLSRAEMFDDVLAAVQRREQIWTKAFEAADQTSALLGARRKALQDLREMVGPGYNLPPPVPLPGYGD